MKLAVKVLEMSNQELSNFLSAALSGSPWFSVNYNQEDYKQANGECIEDKLADILLSDKEIIIYDNEEDIEYRLTLEKVYKGISTYISKEKGRTEIEDYDFNEADCALQCALFGETIYA